MSCQTIESFYCPHDQTYDSDTKTCIDIPDIPSVYDPNPIEEFVKLNRYDQFAKHCSDKGKQLCRRQDLCTGDTKKFCL